MSKRSEKRIEYLSDHHKNFATVFSSLTERYGRFKVWSDFVTMTACAISNACDLRFAKEREAMYMEAVKRYSKEEAEQISELFTETILALEDNPEQDFLGGIFGTLNLHNEWQGQFFTPYHIGAFMAKATLPGLNEELLHKQMVSVCDPCCGAGCLLIACANEVGKMNINYQDKILFVAQDIDFTAAMMCYIQLSLLGCQAIVKVGNSLSDPFTTNEPMSDKLWLTPMLVLKNGIAKLHSADTVVLGKDDQNGKSGKETPIEGGQAVEGPVSA